MDKKKVIAIIAFLFLGFFMFTFANPSEEEIEKLDEPSIEESEEENSEETTLLESVEVNNETNEQIVPLVAPTMIVQNNSNLNQTGNNLNNENTSNEDINREEENTSNEEINNEENESDKENNTIKLPEIKPLPGNDDVVDNAPSMYVIPNQIKIFYGTHIDLMDGVSVIDDEDIVFVLPVQLLTEELEIGEHTISYESSADRKGQVAKGSRTIIVLDPNSDEDNDGYTNKEEQIAGTDFDDDKSYPEYDKKPTIILDENNIYEINIFDEIKEFKATAYDEADGELEVEITNNIDNEKEGTYTVTFKAVDSLGNETIISKPFKVIDDRFEITFVDYDGTEISKQLVSSSSNLQVPDMFKKTYTKANITYEFTGWNKDIDSLTEEATVKAIYDNIVSVKANTYVLKEGVVRPENGTSAGVNNYSSLNAKVELKLTDEIKSVITNGKTKIYALNQDVYNYINSQELPTSEKTGYEYDWYVLKYESTDGWHIDCEEVKTIYSITLNETLNGQVSLDKETATYGEVVTISVVPDKGYELDKILVNGKEISGYTFDVTDNMNVNVTFKKINYSITLDTVLNGKVSIDKETATYGENVNILITPEYGYKLSKIYVNGVESSDSFTMPADNVTVKVEFELKYPNYNDLKIIEKKQYNGLIFKLSGIKISEGSNIDIDSVYFKDYELHYGIFYMTWWTDTKVTNLDLKYGDILTIKYVKRSSQWPWSSKTKYEAKFVFNGNQFILDDLKQI